MIPDEAVEAAAKAIFKAEISGPRAGAPLDALARAALEAAAPFIAAQAIREAVEAFPLETITAPDNAVAWLLRRAEQLEAGR